MQKEQSVIEVNNMSKSVYISNHEDTQWIHFLRSVFFRTKNKTFNILKDITFQVPKLSTLGIIGKNGSGKSSLLKLMANITSPTKGYVKTYGRIAAILDIGSGFHPELTGKENISFYGKIIGMTQKEINQKYSSIVEFSELEDFIHQPVKHYSNGMYLRLAFSVAVHSSVDILLLDEVLTVGDIAFNLKCFQKINELNKNTTIVLVSHNMEDITRVCDLCLWIDNGQLREFGNPHEVVANYIFHTYEGNTSIEEYFSSDNFYKSDFQNELGLGLSSFAIYNSDEIPTKTIDYTEAFYFRFTIIATKALEDIIMPIIQIIDKSNNIAILSSSVFQGEPYIILDEIGEYQFSIKVPKKMLNKGIYRVHFSLLDDHQKICLDKQDIVMFKIDISDPELDKYMKRTSISNSPALKWEMIHH